MAYLSVAALPAEPSQHVKLTTQVGGMSSWGRAVPQPQGGPQYPPHVQDACPYGGEYRPCWPSSPWSGQPRLSSLWFS